MQPYMLEEFPPEISRLQPLFFSSDFGDQGKYLLSLYRSFYLCLCIAHDIIPLRPDLPYPVHDELPALSPKKYNITFAADTCDQQITLANPDKNPCNFTFELYVDQDDSPVYTSDMVKPGSAISHIRLNKTLDKGEHTLSIHISTFDVNSKEPLNSAISNAKLNVI